MTFITDICGNKIDIQGLLNVGNATEENTLEFNMSYWKCHTKGCLIGNFCEKYQNDNLHLEHTGTKHMPRLKNVNCNSSVDSVNKRFGIGLKSAHFLFIPEYATHVTQQEALSRLRKFIYYKLRKAELFADFEKARRTSDTNIVSDTNKNLENFDQNVELCLTRIV